MRMVWSDNRRHPTATPVLDHPRSPARLESIPAPTLSSGGAAEAARVHPAWATSDLILPRRRLLITRDQALAPSDARSTANPFCFKPFTTQDGIFSSPSTTS